MENYKNSKTNEEIEKKKKLYLKKQTENRNIIYRIKQKLTA